VSRAIPGAGARSVPPRENRLLVGPTPVDGLHVLCGLSGYGILASLGAAELLGAHVAGAALPPYAPELALARYQDRDYLDRLPEIPAVTPAR
jgi:glycine/D-amino acid oxidase-like deaminating enzyme